MIFPPYERVIYRKNPLVAVTCQLSFPAILKIDAEVPAAFQERIRGQYPVPQESRAMNLSLPPQIIQSANVPIRLGNVTYQFMDGLPEERVWTVSLTQNSLALSTNNYVRWEDFVQHLTEPLDAFVDVYSPAFFSRIGLRYQNIIQRSEIGLSSVAWKDLLNPRIVGLLQEATNEDEVDVNQGQAVIKLDHMRKVFLQYGMIAEEETKEKAYLIDNDFFTDARTEVNDARQILTSLNEGSGRIFRWAISDRLHRALEPDAV